MKSKKVADKRIIGWTSIMALLDKNWLSYKQWSGHEQDEFAVKYKFKAEALVELLEINLCGSVGGFDRGQTDRTLKGRIGWLKDKM